jgi:hypothetical protein
LYPTEPAWDQLAPPRAEHAWTADGALHPATLLPDQLSDLRDAIQRRFATNWQPAT